MNIWMVLLHSIRASLTAVFLLLLQRLFRDKLSPKWRYTIWIVLLVQLLLPVGWTSAHLDPSVWIDGLRISAELRLDSAWSSPWSQSVPMQGPPRSVTDWLFVLYLLGVFTCAIWLLLGWRKLRWMVKDALPVEGERRNMVLDWAREFELTPPAQIAESQQARGPFLMGVFRPVLVVPMGWQADKNVVLHELLHRKNRDVAAGWITALFRCIHWWNPLLWKVFDRIDNQREERCDQQVLERLRGEERRDYGRTLLSMAEDQAVRAPGATSMANGSAQIKTRIESIAKFKTFPQGMGLVSVCMTLILLPNLVIGFPAFEVPAAYSLPSFVRVLGPGWQIALGNSNRSVTVAGALDTYAKGVRLNNLAWQAAALSEEEYPALWERSGQVPYAYDTGPMFRGVYKDGDGGYWTQMYHFRWEDEGRIGYSRETLHLRPEQGGWSIQILSRGTGQLYESIWPWLEQKGQWFSSHGPDMWGVADKYCIPIPEKPVFTWTGEQDGAAFEFWPETNLTVQDPGGDEELIQALRLKEFVSVEFQEKMVPAAEFSNCKGVLSGQVTNLTDEAKSFTLEVTQRLGGRVFHSDPNDWFSGMYTSEELYVGNDLPETQVHLAPGETWNLREGGQGRGSRHGIPFEQCVAVDVLEARYNGEDLELTREVNLQ